MTAGIRCYGSPGPLRGMKLWTTDGGFRVPGIVRWPGHAPSGTTCDQPVSSLDLLPTLAAFLPTQSFPRLSVLDGTNIVELLHGREIRRDRPLFWVDYNALNDRGGNGPSRWPWKLLARLDGGKLSPACNVTESTADAVRMRSSLTSASIALATTSPSPTICRKLSPQRLAELSAKMESFYRDLTDDARVARCSPMIALTIHGFGLRVNFGPIAMARTDEQEHQGSGETPLLTLPRT